MKQLLQSPTGQTVVAEVPAPRAGAGMILVRTAASLVSAGTERTSVEFAKKSLLVKARSRPDLVKKVLDKARTDGVLSAWATAKARLDQPQALGYSSAGTVIEVGPEVTGFRAGDRVACAGGGYASHAEIARVPVQLAAALPEGVELEHAAFGTVGAIGLHGLRLAEPQLGEWVAVIGLGLIGLLTVQMAKAAGCRVVGIDLDAARVGLARTLGADAALLAGGEEAREAVRSLAGGVGVDAALITAATHSNDPVTLAAELCRDRGRVVVVGAVGMDLPRPPFYEKELSFRVSRSYGPGRYDPLYEEGGMDYPIGYVRWTENRNLAAFLDLVAQGKVRVEPLITHRIPIAEGEQAYRVITGGERSLGVLLTYAEEGASEGAVGGTVAEPLRRVDQPRAEASSVVARVADPGLGLLGAGSFATGTLLPAIQAAGGFRFVGVATATGPSSHHAARKFGFGYATTEESEVLADPRVDLVAVLTRHDLHARQIVAALDAGKHVFCEKPPALDEEQLTAVVQAYARAQAQVQAPLQAHVQERAGRLLAVGFNRRFSPMATRMRAFLAERPEPLLLHCRVNAGAIPASHWVHDAAVGGGRIVGEVCHFVDLLQYLCGALPARVRASGLPDGETYREDNVALVIDFEDGSVGTIGYAAAGDRELGKERVEAFGGGASAVLDDFRALELYRGGTRTRERSRLRQDKGHRGEWEAIGRALRSGSPPQIALEALVATSLATFAAVRALRRGEGEAVDARGWLARALAGASGAPAEAHG